MSLQLRLFLHYFSLLIFVTENSKIEHVQVLCKDVKDSKSLKKTRALMVFYHTFSWNWRKRAADLYGTFSRLRFTACRSEKVPTSEPDLHVLKNNGANY